MEKIKGVCKYCGQLALVEGEFETQEQADRWATMNCDCASATFERQVRENIVNAKARVETLFGSDCEELGFEPVDYETLTFLLNVINEIGSGKIISSSVTLARGGSFKASVTAKGKIKVSRSVGRSYTLES